jgi:hypothetical protein
LIAENWYKITRKEIITAVSNAYTPTNKQNKQKIKKIKEEILFGSMVLTAIQGAGTLILYHQGGSFIQALKDLYPEVSFKKERFLSFSGTYI